MPSTHPRQHGYVLLLTLVMVALVGAGTVGLARTSLARATEAKRAEQELQRRWAEIGCRRALLEQADQLLEQRWRASIETDETAPMLAPFDREALRTLAWRVTLGQLTINIRLSDEQAKLNVNAILDDHDPSEASRLVDTLVRSPGHRYAVELKPAEDPQTSVERVATLERIFNGFAPGLIFDQNTAVHVGLPTDAVTCWGDRRLRLGLASDDALRVLLGGDLEPTRLERLIELRNERPDITVDQALRALALGPSQSSPVRNRLTDRSSCYSLWLTVRSDQRNWHSLDILQTKAPPEGAPEGPLEARHLTYLW